MKQKSIYSVYILRCRDGSLYTGISKDVVARIKLHNIGKGARYTRGRRPCKLIYCESGYPLGDALKREHEIKKLPIIKKVGLIKIGIFINNR